jgi:uncharacterized protein (TIGR02145 family)
MNTKNWSRLMLLFILISIVSYTGCQKDDADGGYIDHTGETGTVTDVDNNVYLTIGIGSQIWMAQNLNVTHYRNGDPIELVENNTAWNALTTGGYCNYNNEILLSSTYGKLYNWKAITDSRNISPEGWHVPTVAEWDTLINRMGGEDVAGSMLKEMGTTHWISGNTDATNAYSFQGIPGGWRINMGSFFYLHEGGYWWTKSNNYLPGGFANAYGLHKDSTAITGYATIQNFGLSVRCVKD